MNPEFRRVLKQQIKQRGHTMASIASALGRSRAWLQRLMAGTRNLREDHLHEILGVLDMSLEELFATYLQEVAAPEPTIQADFSQRPARLLRSLRGRRDPDLGWLERFREISLAPVTRDSWFPLHPRVGRLDDAREHDRQAALVEADSWLRSLYRLAGERRLRPEKTSHLCSALGVWSSIQCALGHLTLATKSLELAFSLHGHAPSVPSWGDLLERTARVAYEYGYPLAGFPLMQQALTIASSGGDPGREVRAMLGLGSLAYRTGQRELARSLFQRILEHPAADPQRTAGAISFLALDAEREGELERATQHLARLAPVLSELPARHRLSLLGRQAHILAEAGELESARALYEQVLQQCRPHFSPIDRSLALLHLLEVLALLGNHDMVLHHARNLNDLLAELEDTPLAREVLNALALAIRQGETLHAERLTETRQRLRACAAG